MNQQPTGHPATTPLTVPATPSGAPPPTYPVPLPEPHTRLRPRSIGGLHLNVEIHGPDDAPTIVLIHGWTCSIPFWAPVIRALRHDLRVVAYDVRGHGASDIPGQGQHSMQALVDDLTTVLDVTLKKGDKAVLVGHSMGGMTIMASALRASTLDRARAVLLASTGFTDLTASSRIFPFIRQPKWRTRVTRHVMGSKLPLGPVTPLSRSMLKYGTLGRQASKELATYNAEIIQACVRRERAAWARVLHEVELGDAIRRLDIPTHVLVGTADRLTPPTHAHRIVETLPRCDGLTELPGIGHMTPLEVPDVLESLIRKLVELP